MQSDCMIRKCDSAPHQTKFDKVDGDPSPIFLGHIEVSFDFVQYARLGPENSARIRLGSSRHMNYEPLSSGKTLNEVEPSAYLLLDNRSISFIILTFQTKISIFGYELNDVTEE